MQPYQIVIDTNVVISALRSTEGASYKLLMRLGDERFQINLSVPLLLEYEEVAKRLSADSVLTHSDIDDVIDYICSVANHCNIFFLWRPYLKDADDDLVLEVAVESQSQFIVTHNTRDFAGIERFGITALTPKEFLKQIGE